MVTFKRAHSDKYKTVPLSQSSKLWSSQTFPPPILSFFGSLFIFICLSGLEGTIGVLSPTASAPTIEKQ